jgi:hypothetical protein
MINSDKTKKKRTNSVALVRERTIQTERPQTFADRGCCVVSTTDPYDRILGSLDRMINSDMS